jgi:hypothetical protein
MPLLAAIVPTVILVASVDGQETARRAALTGEVVEATDVREQNAIARATSVAAHSRRVG